MYGSNRNTSYQSILKRGSLYCWCSYVWHVKKILKEQKKTIPNENFPHWTEYVIQGRQKCLGKNCSLWIHNLVLFSIWLRRLRYFTANLFLENFNDLNPSVFHKLSNSITFDFFAPYDLQAYIIWIFAVDRQFLKNSEISADYFRIWQFSAMRVPFCSGIKDVNSSSNNLEENKLKR